MTARAFWALLTGACLVWYSSITLYVAWRGLRDIRQMLRRLTPPEDATRQRTPGD